MVENFNVNEFFANTFSSDNNCSLSGEGGIFAAPLTLNIAFNEFKDALNIELPKEEMTYEEVYVEFTKYIEIMSLDEINETAKKFIDDFLNNHGGHGLRIYWETQRKGWCNNGALESKYFMYIKDLIQYYNEWMENNLNVQYKVEAYLIGDKIKGLYYNQYSFDIEGRHALTEKEEAEQLWGLTKTIRQSFYDQNLIDTLHPLIKDLVLWCCPKDYQESNLKDKNVLNTLYKELCEVLHKEDGYQGHNFFMKYDGYGITLYDDGTEKRDFYDL